MTTREMQVRVKSTLLSTLIISVVLLIFIVILINFHLIGKFTEGFALGLFISIMINLVACLAKFK